MFKSNCFYSIHHELKIQVINTEPYFAARSLILKNEERNKVTFVDDVECQSKILG
jgi:hypothetical protein